MNGEGRQPKPHNYRIEDMPSTYKVASVSVPDVSYNVQVNWVTGEAYTCSCPHFEKRLAGVYGARCKHFESAEIQHARNRYRDAIKLGRKADLFGHPDDYREAFDAVARKASKDAAIRSTFRFAALLRSGEVEEARKVYLEMIWG